MHAKMRETLVVVGNGMVSQSFCRCLTESLTESERPAIKVFGEEPRPAYDRVKLTDYFSGTSPEKLELASREWYADRGIDLHTAESVIKIDRENRLVRTDRGDLYSFDRLVFATGSLPFVPPSRESISKACSRTAGLKIYRQSLRADRRLEQPPSWGVDS